MAILLLLTSVFVAYGKVAWKRDVDQILRDGIEDGAFPGAVAAIVKGGEVLHTVAVGRHTYEKDATRMTTETLFDLASLT